VRPLDDSHFDFLAHRYGNLREFPPAFTFRSNLNPYPLLQAVELLRTLNQERRRAVPEDAPLKFIPATWHPYVVDRSGRIDRRYYELCALLELRMALRAGDVWLETSRSYANPGELFDSSGPLAGLTPGGLYADTDARRRCRTG